MQGFNMGRYVAPELEGVASGNQVQRQGGQGAGKREPTVRFEMPFAVWCQHCSPASLIAQGVRFNARKGRVGQYHSSAVWSFRMRHGACGGELEIRTDPARAEYVVHAGGARRNYGDDGQDGAGSRHDDGSLALPAVWTDEERARRRADAFGALEGKLDDRRAAAASSARIEQLQHARARDWLHPDEASARLRRRFRAERARAHQGRERVRCRYGLPDGLAVLDASAGDAALAAAVQFGGAGGEPSDAVARPLFRTGTGLSPSGGMKGLNATTTGLNATTTGLNAGTTRSSAGTTKSTAGMNEDSPPRQRRALQDQLRDNTRAVIDPFGVSAPAARAARAAARLKKTAAAEVTTANGAGAARLVDYGSD